MNNLPELTVVLNSSNGIEIRAKLEENYNCVEFTLNSNPQPIFISPWMQFEPSKMADERARIAYEIVHRATNYQKLLEEVDKLKKQLDNQHDYSDRLVKQKFALVDMWRAERKKMGLPDDFSDITEWPPETMSDYV